MNEKVLNRNLKIANCHIDVGWLDQVTHDNVREVRLLYAQTTVNFILVLKVEKSNLNVKSLTLKSYSTPKSRLPPIATFERLHK